jgi:hypothetical protein
VRAVLSQDGHPVAFLCKALSKANQELSTDEKEFLAMLMAVDKYCNYLVRQPFLIKIDHKSLCHLWAQNLSTEMQRNTMVKLAGLQFKLQYKKDLDNKAVDALSRVGHSFSTQFTSAVIHVWIEEILNSYVVDVAAQKLLQELVVVNPNSSAYSLPKGLVRYKKKIWVGANSAIQTKISNAFDASALGGYSGIQATFQKISKLFWWHGLRKVVESFVNQCSVCQQAKHEYCKSQDLLSPPVPATA